MAERLSKTYPADARLQFGGGKKAFAFAGGDGDDGIVFGSREGEHCLLRIDIESSPAGQPLPIDEIVNVQMLYHCGGTKDLRMVSLKSSDHRREVVVLLEPHALTARGTSGSTGDVDRAVKRDARFQLHVQAVAAGSDKIVDIAKTVSWRTVPSDRGSLVAAQGARQETVRCVPHVLKRSFLFFQSTAGRSRRRAKDLSLAHGMRRRRSLRSRTSWRACL